VPATVASASTPAARAVRREVTIVRFMAVSWLTRPGLSRATQT
jgi:hypothetical protein